MLIVLVPIINVAWTHLVFRVMLAWSIVIAALWIGAELWAIT
jgi:hypothetical protein